MAATNNISFNNIAVGSNNTGNATLAVTVPAAGVPSGSLIVVGVVERNASPVIGGSVSDTAGNTYTRVAGITLGASAQDGQVDLYYAWNCSALVSGNTITYTKQTSGDGTCMSAGYITGIDTSADPLDTATKATAQGTGGTATVTSGTPGSSGEVFVGVAAEDNVGPITAPSNWSFAFGDVSNNTSGVCYIKAWPMVNGGTGTVTFTPTGISSNRWGLVLAGFRPASGISVVPISTATQQTGSGTITATVPAGGVPAGSLICVAVDERATVGNPSCADAATNTYTRILSEVATSRGQLDLFYAWNASALTAGQTITVTKAGNDAIAVSAFYATGIQTSSDPHDSAVDAVATGSTTTPSVTSGTPSASGDLFVALLAQTNTSTFTQDTTHGWLSPPPIEANPGGTSPAQLDGGTQINSGTGTITFAPTITSATQWAIGVTAFKKRVTQFTQTITATQAQTVSTVKQAAKIVSATQAQVASVQKAVSKFLAMTQAQAASVIKRAGKIVSMTAATAASVIKQANKTVSATQAQAVSVVKSVGKIVSATQAQTVTVAAAKTIHQLVSATVTTAASVIKQAGKIVSATQAQAVLILKRAGKIVSATQGQSVTIATPRTVVQAVAATCATAVSVIKQAGKIVSATQAQSIVVIKQVSKFLATTTTTSVVVTGIKVFLVTITTACTTAVVFGPKQVGKIVAATVTETVSTLKAVTKSPISITVSTAASVIKQVNKFLAVSSATSVVITAFRIIPVLITTTCTTAVVVIKQALKNITAAVSTAVTMQRTISKNLSMTASTAVLMVKQVAKSLTTSSATAVSVQKAIAKAAFSIAVSALVTVTKQATKSFSVSSSTSVSVQRTVSKLLSVSSATTVSTVRAVSKSIAATVVATVSARKFVSKTLAYAQAITVSVAAAIVVPYRRISMFVLRR